jgi:hypothetical protein
MCRPCKGVSIFSRDNGEPLEKFKKEVNEMGLKSIQPLSSAGARGRARGLKTENKTKVTGEVQESTHIPDP